MLHELDIFKNSETGDYQIRNKSVVFSLGFDDSEQEQIFIEVVELVKEESNHSMEKLRDQLFEKFESIRQSKVLDVLDGLFQNDLLPVKLPANNSQNKSTVIKRSGFSVPIEKAKIAIIGDSELRNYIANKAQSNLFKEVKAFKFDEISVDEIFDNYHMIVVDNTCWNPYYLELINNKALEVGKPWLHVGGIDDGSMKLGPLFFGKETGCYNCLISRIKSNQDEIELFNDYETYLRKNKQSSKADSFSHSTILLDMLSNMVAMELVKFFEGWSLPIVWKRVLKMDIVKYNISKHELLKKPYCEVCKPELLYNTAPWLEAITLS